MRRLPRKDEYERVFKIGDNDWTFEFGDTGGGKKLRVHGICDDGTKTVTLDRTNCRKEIFHTVIHELLHCFEFEYGIAIPHRVVYALEEPLYRFIRDNFE